MDVLNGSKLSQNHLRYSLSHIEKCTVLKASQLRNFYERPQILGERWKSVLVEPYGSKTTITLSSVQKLQLVITVLSEMVKTVIATLTKCGKL